MRIKLEQLTTVIRSKLAPVYLVSGDEPLQLAEAADEIRAATKQAGCAVREVLVADAQFDWQQLLADAANLSIFAQKKMIDLRLPTAKLSQYGAKVLYEYCQHLPADTVLLITTGKLSSATLKSQWCQAVEKIGVHVQVWPLQAAELVPWLQRRSQKKGMSIEQDALKLLATRIEGNLLAASQEIEKLYILYGANKISLLEIEQAVADHARFDLFQLTDGLLAGKITRSIKILFQLKAEGNAAAIILWALSREARLLLHIKTDQLRNENLDRSMNKYQVWGKRKQLVHDAIRRLDSDALKNILYLCAIADRQIKGNLRGDCWETLLVLCQHFCGMDDASYLNAHCDYRH